MTDIPPSLPIKVLINTQEQFSKWSALNDTIMGGRSQGFCKAGPEGLSFYGQIIEEGGGFVSCRSEILSLPLNLSKYKGLDIEVVGQGLTLKLAISCTASNFSIAKYMNPGVKWVASIPTNKSGITVFRIPFRTLEPSLRAKKVYMPIKFNSSCINQFQLLHSRFGLPGTMNTNFKPGPFTILLKKINAYS
tara:strand:- start:8608 stop:9180 length:573 start_codon:yes stop_codon:yes gene_type:complete